MIVMYDRAFYAGLDGLPLSITPSTKKAHAGHNTQIKLFNFVSHNVFCGLDLQAGLSNFAGNDF